MYEYSPLARLIVIARGDLFNKACKFKYDEVCIRIDRIV